MGTSHPSWAYVGKETTAIDELRVYRRVLTADEVRSVLNDSLSKNKLLAEAFEDRRKQREKRQRDNLVRAGGYLLASSFMDYKDHYTDNLIDGDRVLRPPVDWRLLLHLRVWRGGD